MSSAPEPTGDRTVGELVGVPTPEWRSFAAPRVARVEVLPLSSRLPSGAAYGSAKALAAVRTATLVRLTTDDGAVGWGECYGPPEPIAAALHSLSEDIHGYPVDRVLGLLPAHLSTQYHVASAGSYCAALSGLELAMWDVWARTLGVGVAQLFGGRLRDRVNVYASTGYSTETDDLDQFRSSIRTAVEAGFSAAKIKVGFGAATDERRTAIAREELGPERRLMVDFNGNGTADLALASLDRLAAFDLTWAEEPLHPDDHLGWAHIRRHTAVPLAGGETLCTRFGFRELISQHLVDLVQPDVSLCGGFTEARAVADMANAYHVRVTPHVWGGAVSLAASLQFASTLSDHPFGRIVPEPLWFEWDCGENPLRDELLVEPLATTGGFLDIPLGPGFGVDVDETIVAEHLMAGHR